MMTPIFVIVIVIVIVILIERSVYALNNISISFVLSTIPSIHIALRDCNRLQFIKNIVRVSRFRVIGFMQNDCH